MAQSQDPARRRERFGPAARAGLGRGCSRGVHPDSWAPPPAATRSSRGQRALLSPSSPTGRTLRTLRMNDASAADSERAGGDSLSAAAGPPAGSARRAGQQWLASGEPSGGPGAQPSAPRPPQLGGRCQAARGRVCCLCVSGGRCTGWRHPLPQEMYAARFQSRSELDSRDRKSVV